MYPSSLAVWSELNACEIELIGEITGTTPRVNIGPERHGDLRYFVCDTARARKHLGWKPEVAPREGVSRLLRWIRENQRIFA